MFNKNERNFWKKVLIGNDCWEWQASKVKGGYGVFYFRDRTRVAHRVVFELWYGTDPGKLKVCHKCDNPGCVRPSHLFLGTQKENMRDCSAKGRVRKPTAKTKEIWDKIQAGERQSDLSREYGISRQRVGQIKAKYG